jgi:integrase
MAIRRAGFCVSNVQKADIDLLQRAERGARGHILLRLAHVGCRIWAVHLCEAGIPLPYIRDILGHVDLSTTEIYARASTEAKRKALEAAYTDIVTDDLPEWNQNPGLLNWLASL